MKDLLITTKFIGNTEFMNLHPSHIKLLIIILFLLHSVANGLE